MRLCGEMENRIDFVGLETFEDVALGHYVAVVEAEVWVGVEQAGVVEGAAVVEFVEGDYVV